MAFQTTTLTSDEYETKTLETRVLEWTEQLCESLAENYKQYHRRMVENNAAIFNNDGSKKDLSDYAQQQIDALNDGTFKGMKYTITSGKKYHKIIQNDFRNGKYESAGVHAFVDKTTGEVYKPASWRAPAKHVRFDMRDQNQREYMYANCDWAGGYLYIR